MTQRTSHKSLKKAFLPFKSQSFDLQLHLYAASYLKGRGFTFDDYEFFPVGTTRGLNFRYDDYVIFLVIDSGDTVGYVARHLWPKAEIDAYNRRAKFTGDYAIRRFRNSTPTTS